MAQRVQTHSGRVAIFLEFLLVVVSNNVFVFANHYRVLKGGGLSKGRGCSWGTLRIPRED